MAGQTLVRPLHFSPMKTLLLISTLLLLSISITNGQPLGSSCANPKILTVNDSVCVYVSTPGKEISQNFDSLPVAFFNNTKIKPKAVVWYSFTASSKNVAFQVRDAANFSAAVYSGTCGALTLKTAFCSYPVSNFYMGAPSSTETLIGAVENLTPGQTYYFQVISPFLPFNDGPVCIYKLPDAGAKVVSTAQGGSWLTRSTWQQGRVPTPIDTALIVDGATVTLSTAGNYAVRRLEIGQAGAAIGRLKVQTPVVQLSVYGDLVIGLNDSLVAPKNTLAADRYLLYGHVVNNGVFSYFKKNQAGMNIAKPDFHFRGLNPQVVSGTGVFAGCGIPTLVIDNPAGVEWRMSGYMRSQLYLKRGLFNNSLADIVFHFDTLNPGGDASVPSVSVENGRLSKKIPNVSTKLQGLKSNSLVYGLLKDDSLQANSEINFDDYYPVKTAFSNFTTQKWGGRKINLNRSLTVFTLSMTGNGILNAGPSDTLTFRTASFIAVSKIRHTRFGYYRNIFSIGSGDWSIPAWVGGKGRSFGLKDYNINAPAGQWLQARVLNQPPGGSIAAPGTFLMGPHVVEITSNTALGPSTKLRMEVYHSDSLYGLKNNWRIAQSTSPTGPWTVLNVTTSYVEPTDSLLTAILTTANPISLANGNYFAFASVGNPTDAVLSRVIPIPTYGFGCNANQTTTVKMLVNNNGLSPLTEVLAGALVNGSLYSQSYTVGSNWSALAVGATDTLRFSMPGDLAINGPVKFFVSATGEGNRSNDTLKVRLNTLAMPIPAWINFDTCKYLGLVSLGLFKYGYPIIAGWGNDTKGPPNISGGTHGNAFASTPTYSGTSNQRHLFSTLYFPYGAANLRSFNFGPIGSSTWLSYRFNIEDDPSTIQEIRSTDTLVVEVSADCGQTYVPLRTINRLNFVQYLDPGALLYNSNLPPPSVWWDSLPFPPGSLVHFRFRMKANQSPFSFTSLRLDDVRVVDTLFTGLRPGQERAQQMLLYPNPASEEVFLSMPGGEPLSGLCLVDALGRCLPLPLPPPNGPVSLRGIPPGVYLLEAKTPSQRYQKRLMVRLAGK